ncbi:MAG: HIT family protein [Myxococcales bacterium FL481]|nr:MAG: HIT family protein [Myxococcales bacterium FL481]
MIECIFCKLIAGELPCHRVGENEYAFAFLDIHPLVDGHTMVVPKRHHAQLESLADEEVAGVMSLARDVSAALRGAMAAEAAAIGINNGSAAGQLVDHVHVHIIPRFADDRGGSVHAIVRSRTAAALPEVAAKLAAQLDRSRS